MTDRFILQPERREITGISDVSWWRMEKAGTAPRRRQISPGRVAWLESEVMAWLESRPYSDIPSPKKLHEKEEAIS